MAPSAPTAPSITAFPGMVRVSASTVTSDKLELQIATNVGFTTGVVTHADTYLVSGTVRDDFIGLAAGTYYFRARVPDSGSGASAYTATVSATVPARRALDVVEGAAVAVSGVHCSLRFDPATGAVTIGYSNVTAGTTWTSIATIDTTTSAGFAITGGLTDLALVANAAGDLFVVGIANDTAGSRRSIRTQRFLRSGTTTWALSGSAKINIGAPSGRDYGRVSAAYVPGIGGTPKDTIMVFTEAAALYAYSLDRASMYAVINVAGVANSGATSVSDAFGDLYSSVPFPTASDANIGRTDVAPLVPNGTRLAMQNVGGRAVFDVLNGVITSVSIVFNAPFDASKKTRILGIDASTFAILGVISGALVCRFYNTAGTQIGTASYAGTNAQGAAFADQWGAYYSSVAGVIRVYYIADDSARKLESIDITVATYTYGTAVVLTSALGSASSASNQVRIARGKVDERRVLVETANLLTGTHSIAAYADTQGNVAPSAPTLVTRSTFDAATAADFTWAFGDTNPLDTQTAYQLQIDRVSTGLNVYDSGKVSSTTALKNLAAATLTNAIQYRWRVRTYDVLDTVGTWSSYSTFTPAAGGTLTITYPASDNPAGYELSSVPLVWTYTQANGFTQAKRRVRAIRTSDSVVLSDTTLQANTTLGYTVTGLPSGIEVRLEVTVENTNGDQVVANRLVTPDYSKPMTPTLILAQTETGIQATVTNPAPTGSRPEVVGNWLYRSIADADEYERIAIIAYNGSYVDRAVGSDLSYDYYVVGSSV